MRPEKRGEKNGQRPSTIRILSVVQKHFPKRRKKNNYEA